MNGFITATRRQSTMKTLKMIINQDFGLETVNYKEQGDY